MNKSWKIKKNSKTFVKTETKTIHLNVASISYKIIFDCKLLTNFGIQLFF